MYIFVVIFFAVAIVGAFDEKFEKIVNYLQNKNYNFPEGYHYFKRFCKSSLILKSPITE